MEMEKLKNRDYWLILDKSGSMSTRDCPGNKTRWEYAQESAVALARKCQEYDPDGITVVPFSGNFKVYDNTTADKVGQVFAENDPMGSTDLTKVLTHVFTDYTTRKAAKQTKANGQIVLVITDGVPDDEASTAKAIVEFGNKLGEGADEEFGISFIQIGKDAHAAAFLKRLDDNLVKEGAKYDIVDTKTMEEVESIGINEALIAALTD